MEWDNMWRISLTYFSRIVWGWGSWNLTLTLTQDFWYNVNAKLCMVTVSLPFVMLSFKVTVKVWRRPSCFDEQSLAELAHSRVFSFTFTNKLLVECKTILMIAELADIFPSHTGVYAAAFLLLSPYSECRGACQPVTLTPGR